jgi:hypothetical protein
MFERFDRSLRLLKESWAVLSEERGLIVFPICSGICSILAALAFTLPWVILSDVVGQLRRFSIGGPGHQHVSFGLSGPIHYAGMFLFYLVTYTIVVFFNVGLVACAGERLRGGRATPADGLRIAMSNFGRIVAWSAVAATVGTILRAIEERASWLGQIVSSILGLVWTLATTFVVPVLVFERVGPFDALKRSVAVFRKTWGEAVVGNAGLSLIFGLASLLGLVPLLLGFLALPWGLVAGGAIALAYWLALTVIQAALQGIYQTAVYEYAARGTMVAAFSPDLITQAYVPKR